VDSAAVVIVIGVALTAMLKDAVADWVGDEPSVTCIPKVDVPAVAGVPEITQEVESVRPAGSEPEASPNVYGVVPFAALTV
jgi:hypothetical protein